MINLAAAQPALARLAKLRCLPDGWNFGDGLAPSWTAHTHATALLLTALSAGADNYEFFPEDEGGILVIMYRGEESFEILAKSDGQFEVAYEANGDLTPAMNLKSLQEVRDVLEHKGWQSAKSSGSFTRVILASEKADTHLLPFGLPKAAFQSSIRNVLPARGIPAVPMQKPTIRDASEGRQRYFGESKQQNLLLATS